MNEANGQMPLGFTSLAGSVALVVGGYGAIGTTISETLARAGAVTVIAGRDEKLASELSNQIAREGNRAEGLGLDASNVANVRDGVARIAKHFGSVDILVNCVGYNKEQPFLEVTEEAFDEVYSRTLRPGMFLSQAVGAEQVRTGKGGSQIHLLSIRSFLGFRNRGYSSFCAAKGGLAALIKQQATELAPHGITVNGVVPGLVLTRKNEKSFESPEVWERTVADIPLGRLATPSDVAGAVLFFASSSSRFATGQILHVDGGLTACT
ncbi:SDR family oxidoreductase [Aquamicrobium sp. NLF2-7]|uniref:SDR family NAD(P)-dependent oxidoreductase n=1 Tax=Aquamicrobium sp. NLF2-7 TaxID=2918753 RepID=UPI001EFA8B9A|nr:SDR family oxidoreductase [Aquamicrobium sp. NLF2-7]MCG8273810.1 SDR family oxidoreductase [Aquamicrobium sp. NLF2-7]MCG8273962.1 SDR family oxidoreductase [Aquamicrobium sp. NLF2-7]